MVRQRSKASRTAETESNTTRATTMPETAANAGLHLGGSRSWSTRTQWIFFAVASGACAAFNGVFAKLTTTGLTSSLSKSIAGFFGLSSAESVVEVIVRGTFFVLNLTFNGIMWTLFTTALARGTSTTQVSIMNTSTNFVLTALLGLMIFSEALPTMWWVGAAFLIVGNVIVGRKDESKDSAGAEGGYAPVPHQDGTDDMGRRKDDEDEDVIDLGNVEDRR